MSRPLVAKQSTEDAADAFHRAVFAAHGRTCFFHGPKFKFVLDFTTRKPRPRKPEERCEKDATDAMHVVPRSQLGPKSRFACPDENGRPGCRTCHDLEDAGRLDFPDAIYNRAIRALQAVTPRIGLRER
jgi:hypothetical protein